ncbi:hypothetical protein LCGC14_0946450 [marine sediment metagenome]|uniref:C2H2-type domain-containing protein n=1 Tax=marine sediment metagenome TaxID=412755 RepID=A0A0F9P4N5_9ZZZZ
MRHFCRHSIDNFNKKKKYRIIVKKPRGILVKKSPSCPVCGKLFQNSRNLKNHLEDSKKTDSYHELFLENKFSFEAEYSKNRFKKNWIKLNHMINQNSGKLISKKRNILTKIILSIDF